MQVSMDVAQLMITKRREGRKKMREGEHIVYVCEDFFLNNFCLKFDKLCEIKFLDLTHSKKMQ